MEADNTPHFVEEVEETVRKIPKCLITDILNVDCVKMVKVLEQELGDGTHS